MMIKFFKANTVSVGVHEPQPSRARRALTPGLVLVVSLGLFVFGGGFCQPGAAADSGPIAATQTMVNQALQILRATNTPLNQRRRQLRELIEPRFDFSQMSRSALGYHWRSLSPDQRNEFTRLFTAFIEDAYLSKIQNYSGQKVEFVRQTSLGQGCTEVDTKIVQPGGKSPIPLNYLLQPIDGGWKIYDVTVDNISIVANYRNQFNRVINNQGFDKLMTDLRAKQQNLASRLGDQS